MRSLPLMVLLVSACTGGVATPVEESDTDTDADSDTDVDADIDADTDTDVGCVPLDVNGAVSADAEFEGFQQWDEGITVSACVSGNRVEGQANLFMRAPGGGPEDSWCAVLYDMEGVDQAGCSGCDIAFDPDVVQTGSIDLFAPGTTCDRLESAVYLGSWGVQLDDGTGPRLWFQSKGWYPVDPSEAELTVTPFGDDLRVDWVWKQYYGLD